MVFSSKNIKDDFEKINNALAKLKESYTKSEWNDSVKESFSHYINICKEKVNNLNDCCEKSDRICNNLNCLNIDAKLSKSNILNAKTLGLIAKATELCMR